MSIPDFSQFPFNLLAGFTLGAVIGLFSLRTGSLSRSGAAAATLTGGLIFGLGGLPWAVLLLLFFISSSGLSHAFKRRKLQLSEKFAKGSTRDWGQVLANGGLGAMLAVVHAIFPDEGVLWAAFGGAMAAVNADTWATELGVLSSQPPRLVTTGVVVERGSSGGITRMGNYAALGGAALIALVGGSFLPDAGQFIRYFIFVSFAGTAGSIFDSFLGATVQAIYTCPACSKETERHPRHICGTETVHKRGWRWLNNDLVNFACSLVGAVIAAGLWLLF
ncbi:MAG: DUF92 domain-containing protein [Chloroflexi bacterium]|nr:MAG: DUF92 domain-containing protein [Chloroflexota bacterium]